MTYDWTTFETDAIENFLKEYFPSDYIHDTSTIEPEEEEEIRSLVDHVAEIFDQGKGYLGLAIDFLMIAELISKKDRAIRSYNSDLELDDFLNRYEQASTAATLTLKYDDVSAGIRSVHEKITDLFREDLQRSNFPSAAPHYTGEWQRYEEWVGVSFRLSRAGRYEAALRLFTIGLENLEARTHVSREPPFPDPFLAVLQEYRRKDPDEEAGSAYQAFAFGYVSAEWPHLFITASKLRTGSSRQHRYGDVDGFYGPDLMISVEAKDKLIDENNVKGELGTMMELAGKTTAIAIAMCREVEGGARDVLIDAGVKIITDTDIERQLQVWDYHKQNKAIQGMAHFLGNIEENPAAVQRLLKFIEDLDPSNNALAHLVDPTDS